MHGLAVYASGSHFSTIIGCKDLAQNLIEMVLHMSDIVYGYPFQGGGLALTNCAFDPGGILRECGNHMDQKRV